jgi:hypothetical protein
VSRADRLLGWLVAGALLAGCGISTDSAPRPLDPRSGPYQQDGENPSPAPTGGARTVVYLVRDAQLVAVVRRIPTHPTAADVLATLVSGPTARESSAGLATAVPLKAVVDKSSTTARIPAIAVPLPSVTDSGRNDEVLGYAQVVLSLTGLAGVKGVRFTRDGQPLDVPRADGSLSHGPLTRRDYAALL